MKGNLVGTEAPQLQDSLVKEPNDAVTLLDRICHSPVDFSSINHKSAGTENLFELGFIIDLLLLYLLQTLEDVHTVFRHAHGYFPRFEYFDPVEAD